MSLLLKCLPFNVKVLSMISIILQYYISMIIHHLIDKYIMNAKPVMIAKTYKIICRTVLFIR